MVNHVRTWLANLSASNGLSPGEEFISSQFQPISEEKMSAALRKARRVLFGVQPSRESVLVKVAVYLQIIHVSSLSGRITDKDPRITYEVDGSGIVGSSISSDDLAYDIKATIDLLEFLTNPSVDFFSGYPDHLAVWQQSNEQFDRLAAALLVIADKTEKAAIGTE